MNATTLQSTEQATPITCEDSQNEPTFTYTMIRGGEFVALTWEQLTPDEIRQIKANLFCLYQY